MSVRLAMSEIRAKWTADGLIAGDSEENDEEEEEDTEYDVYSE